MRREKQNAKRCIILRKGNEQRELSHAKDSNGAMEGEGLAGGGGGKEGRERMESEGETGGGGGGGGVVKEGPRELSMSRAGRDQSCSCGSR